MQMTTFDYAALDVRTREAVERSTREIRSRLQQTVDNIQAIGRQLLAVKEALPHGQFGPWLALEFAWSHDTANRFMNVARNLPQIPHGAEFPLQALYQLAAPSTPEAARQEALDRAAAGEMIGPAEAQRIITDHQPARLPLTVLEAATPAPSAGPKHGGKMGTRGRDVFLIEDWEKLSRERQRELLNQVGSSQFNFQETDSIEWAFWSWNPVTGCLHNCPYCYARDIAHLRYQIEFNPALWPYRRNAPHNTAFPEGKIAAALAEQTDQGRARALGLGNVFVCSQGDLFGGWLPAEWIEAVLAECRAAPQWNFLFLTKSPPRLAKFTFPDNAWVGTTVDCQARVANAEKAFRKVKAGVKWLSCEPLIEPLHFEDLGAFDWMVLGGASPSTQTPGFTPPLRWVVDLEEAAAKAGVPFYEKENLGARSQRIRQYPGDEPHRDPDCAPAELRYLTRPADLES
jgi:protein gp37